MKKQTLFLALMLVFAVSVNVLAGDTTGVGGTTNLTGDTTGVGLTNTVVNVLVQVLNYVS